MASVRERDCHFVRCLRPNEALKPRHFDSACLLRQLQGLGAVDLARVQKAGLPARLRHEEFVARYRPVAPSDVPRLPNESAKKSVVVCSLLRLRLSTGPVYELFAKYTAKIAVMDAWPDIESDVTWGIAKAGPEPALHEGAHA